MEEIQRKAAKNTKAKQDSVRLGSFTIHNVKKTQDSITKARIEAGRNLRKVQDLAAAFVKEIALERAQIADNQLGELKSAAAQINKAQKAADKQKEEEAMVRIFFVVLGAMKKQKQSVATLNKCVKNTSKIISDISVYEKSCRMCLKGFKQACDSMFNQARPFFLTVANLQRKTQFFSKEQVDHMDITHAINECNRERTLAMQFDEDEEAGAGQDMPESARDKKLKLIADTFRTRHTKKDIAMIEKIALLVKSNKKSQISKDDKLKVLKWYDECRRYLTANVRVFDSKIGQVEQQLVDFASFHKLFDDELEKMLNTLQHKHRVVIDQ